VESARPSHAHVVTRCEVQWLRQTTMCHVLRCALPRLALPVPYSTTLMWRVPHLMLSSDTAVQLYSTGD
jgi:hypothetical protein